MILYGFSASGQPTESRIPILASLANVDCIPDQLRCSDFHLPVLRSYINFTQLDLALVSTRRLLEDNPLRIRLVFVTCIFLQCISENF